MLALKLENGHVITNDDEIADSMKKYFASVFTNEKLSNMPSFDDVISDHKMSFIQCTEEEVAKYLSQLNPKKSLGPDGIHPRILKACAATIALSLCCLLNKSFDLGM